MPRFPAVLSAAPPMSGRSRANALPSAKRPSDAVATSRALLDASRVTALASAEHQELHDASVAAVARRLDRVAKRVVATGKNDGFFRRPRRRTDALGSPSLPRTFAELAVDPLRTALESPGSIAPGGDRAGREDMNGGESSRQADRRNGRRRAARPHERTGADKARAGSVPAGVKPVAGGPSAAQHAGRTGSQMENECPARGAA
jgi:hypothetical protein